MKRRISDPREAITPFLDAILKGSDGTVAIGPVVWDVPPGSDQREWYFVLGTGTRSGDLHVSRLLLKGSDRAMCEAMQAETIAEIVSRRGPFVIHTFDDELNMAQWCAELWPCPKARRIVRGLEQERATGRRP